MGLVVKITLPQVLMGTVLAGLRHEEKLCKEQREVSASVWEGAFSFEKSRHHTVPSLSVKMAYLSMRDFPWYSRYTDPPL